MISWFPATSTLLRIWSIRTINRMSILDKNLWIPRKSKFAKLEFHVRLAAFLQPIFFQTEFQLSFVYRMATTHCQLKALHDRISWGPLFYAPVINLVTCVTMRYRQTVYHYLIWWSTYTAYLETHLSYFGRFKIGYLLKNPNSTQPYLLVVHTCKLYFLLAHVWLFDTCRPAMF